MKFQENVTSYNPKEYCEQRGVLRHRDVAPPSERKEFRHQERRRLQEINNEESRRQTQKPNPVSIQIYILIGPIL